MGYTSSSSSSSSSCHASAWIFLTLSRHSSLLSTGFGRSSGQQPISTQLLYVGSSWLSCLCLSTWRGMSTSLLLQQCPACLVRLTWIIFVMSGKWPYSCCFLRCYLQDLFNNTHSILVLLPSRFFSTRLVSIHVVHPYSSNGTTAAWKKLHFILSVRSDFQ